MRWQPIWLAWTIQAAACGFSPESGETVDAQPEVDASIDATDVTLPPPRRINLGSDLVSYEGQGFPGTWLGGQNACSGLGVDTAAEGVDISGTLDDPLFRDSLFGRPVACEFEVAAPSYAITLLFAEIFYGGGACPGPASTRETEILINGVVVDSFDIAALSGGCVIESQNGAPFTKTYKGLPTTDGKISVELRDVIGGNTPSASAIELIPLAE